MNPYKMMIQRSYSNSNFGKLYLIPTPIGNLEDVTIRSIGIITEVDKIYAEDTRVASILLRKFKLLKKVRSCHKYSEMEHKDQIIAELKSGLDIAYMSDRGTPLISDPGSVIVEYAIANGISVIALPGASAFLPAINMSGLNNDKFLFYGFLNRNQNKKISELKAICKVPFTIIFYEAPHRITNTLNVIMSVFGNRNVSIAREISKIHEEIFRGTLEDAIKYSENIKGEIVIVVDGYKGEIENVDYIDAVNVLINKGYKTSEAIKEIANLYDISRHDLYEEFMRTK